MYHSGLKLWSCNTDDYYQEAIRLYEQKIFDYIELYVLPGTLHYLQKWKNLKIPFIIHCAHSAHGFNLADKSRKESNREIYFQTKRYADDLNAKYIIFHGGCDGCIEETAKQLSAFREPRALIENKPVRALQNSFGAKFCRGFNIDELKFVMNASGCGLCLDIGHAVCAANSLKQEPYQSIMEHIKTLNPVIYHLSDIADLSSEFDDHSNLGAGQLDISKVLSFIADDSYITVETNKKRDLFAKTLELEKKYLQEHSFSIRPAREKDIRAIYDISNDPYVRQFSFHQEKITWNDHCLWFKNILNCKESNILIAANNATGQIIAQIRFQPDANARIRISISFEEKFRKHGLAQGFLFRSLIFREKLHGKESIFASIKKENDASIRLFNQCGFKTIAIFNNTVEKIYE